MSTPFTDVYDIFLSQISDPTYLSIPETDEFNYRYLLNSIPKFRRCVKDLSDRDEINGIFNVTLSDEEKLILGILMVTEYLNPQIVSINNLKQVMTNRDFQVTSQAAHLKELMDLRKMKLDEVNKLIIDYTYNNNDMSGLK